jgi:hypothetical protein
VNEVLRVLPVALLPENGRSAPDGRRRLGLEPISVPPKKLATKENKNKLGTDFSECCCRVL